MNEIIAGKGKKGIAALTAVFIIAIIGAVALSLFLKVAEGSTIPRFTSCNALFDTFNDSYNKYGMYGGMYVEMLSGALADVGASAPAQYSRTTVQVEGVDEADIVKTDGEFIYMLSTSSGNNLIIAKAYPVEEAQVISETDLGDFGPIEIFIDSDSDMVLIFGYTYEEIERYVGQPDQPVILPEPEIYPYYASLTTVQLWDVTDRSSPELVRSVDFEGSYLSSRKIGSQVYFIVNSNPNYYYILAEGTSGQGLIPSYRDMSEWEIESGQEEYFVPTCDCAEVGYFEPVNPERFTTIASISMSDPQAAINREVIVGSGQNIYSSQQNLYVAEMNYPFWRPWTLEEGEELQEITNVHKFSLSGADVNYIGVMNVPGRVLNQFSMDENNDYFRIATTKGWLWTTDTPSTNNVYVYDSGMSLVGSLEGLAPGEEIYSARFMGDRGYLVTFKKIDPFFAIDLSDPSNPTVLGKLKIPGYSDYLHPYDENHIIGIGKETVEAEDDWGWGSDFAWYQGIKMAIFDVTDVSNPVELHKVVIGDRGTDSEVLRTHKAFLFDREKNLLVIPILLAEISGDPEDLPDWTYGDYVYQGAYVYDITLENGFVLKGRITHYESDEPFQNSGWYFYDMGYSVKRSLYIDNVLYTISDLKIGLNSLDDLAELKELKFGLGG